MGDQLMLDPSTLLGEEGFDWLRDESDLSGFVVPRHFVDQLNHQAEYTDSDESLFGSLPEGDDRKLLASYLQKMTLFDSGKDIRLQQLPQDVRDVANHLREFGSVLAEEEWLYLCTHSWLAARADHVFSAFRHAGAASVVVGRHALEKVVTRALKLPEGTPNVLSRKLLTRAGIKFLATGGPAVAPLLLQPVTAAALGIAAVGLICAAYILFADGVPPKATPDQPPT